MRFRGLRLAALLGVAFLINCSNDKTAMVRMQNDTGSTVSLVLTRSGGGTVTVGAPANTLSDYVDLPVGEYTVSNNTPGLSLSGTTFVAVETDNYTLEVANSVVTVKRE